MHSPVIKMRISHDGQKKFRRTTCIQVMFVPGFQKITSSNFTCAHVVIHLYWIGCIIMKLNC